MKNHILLSSLFIALSMILMHCSAPMKCIIESRNQSSTSFTSRDTVIADGCDFVKSKNGQADILRCWNENGKIILQATAPATFRCIDN